MWGIIIKDFYESFCIRKNLLGLIFSLICLLFAITFARSMYMLVLLIVVTLPMISVSTLQYSMEQDEIAKFDQILLTFPLTRKEIVKAKIIATYLCALLSTLLVSLPIILFYVGYYQVTDIQTGLLIFGLGIIATAIMTPLNNIGFIWLGNKKGTILYIIILIILAIGYVILNFVVGIEQIMMISLHNWIIIGGVLAMILNVLGYYACVKIYTLKNS